jgi:ABC-type sugar transport system permease subunit
VLTLTVVGSLSLALALNQALRGLGLPVPGWASDAAWAMPTVIVTFSWREVGYFTVTTWPGSRASPPSSRRPPG